MYIIDRTYALLFGSVRHDIRNSIAHRRYDIKRDGSVDLYDFDPAQKRRKHIGRFSQNDVEALARHIQTAVDVFEMSLLIFQHNHGSLLFEMGYYSGKEDYTDEEIVELLHREAPSAFLRVQDVTFEDGSVELKVKTSFPAFARSETPSTVYVSTKDKSGNPLKYQLEVPPVHLSVRSQSFRFLQKASLYCKRFREIEIRTVGLDDKEFGRARATIEYMQQSLKDHVEEEEFTAGLLVNTFPDEKAVRSK